MYHCEKKANFFFFIGQPTYVFLGRGQPAAYYNSISITPAVSTFLSRVRGSGSATMTFSIPNGAIFKVAQIPSCSFYFLQQDPA